MEIKQVYQFVNDAQKEVLGESAIQSEDLSDIVDIGTAISSLADGYDKFYGALVNRIGRMIFVDRVYKGRFAKLFRESWEFGSILGKVQAELMDATENESWEIVNGASYDPFVVNLPVVSQKFYNKMATLELDMTTPTEQVKQSFKSRDEMVRFLSMLETQINNSMELKLEILASRCVNNLIASSVDAGGAHVINLVTEYNSIAGTSLTATTCLVDAEFLRYAVGRILDVKSFLKDYSKLYNLGQKARFTPDDAVNFEVNSVFASRMKTHLQSTTYHDELVKLPGYEEVSHWQGVGTGGALADRTKIDVTAVLADGTTKAVTATNVVGVMFDHDACGILQPNKRVTTAYNPKAEYYQAFHKWDSRYFNDFNENAVVFTLN